MSNESLDGGASETLPDLCYVFTARHRPGERIVIVKRGERGFYTTNLGHPQMSAQEAEAIVDSCSVRLRGRGGGHEAGVSHAKRDMRLPYWHVGCGGHFIDLCMSVPVRGGLKALWACELTRRSARTLI